MSCKHISNHQSIKSAVGDIVSRMPLLPEFMSYFLYVSGPGANERHSIAGVGCGNYQGGGSSVNANGALGLYRLWAIDWSVEVIFSTIFIINIKWL